MEKLKFDKNGLVPAIVQDFTTGEVLMLAYMNELALDKTLETGKTHFWSRSRNKLWMKGEESGNIQVVKQMLLDCDNDSLLVRVEQKTAACHTGYVSCFYREIAKDGSSKIVGKKVFNPEDVYPAPKKP